jgi:ribonuclease HII
VRRRRSGPLQAGLFELEEDLYAQERGAWARGLWVAGVDEVGRGPLAGPVVAAAVILDPAAPVDGLRDSKLLTARQRRRLAREIRVHALAFAVGRVGPRRIDMVNVLQATWHAMRAALAGLRVAPGLILVDGHLRIPGVTCAQRAIIAGDRRSASVAAASILAKVARDTFMLRVDRRYPEYGFRRHKGYATAAHLEALARLGPCPLHRRSFHGVGGVGGEPVDPSPELPLLC